MTITPIIASFQWTPDQLLQARRYHFRHICRPVFRFLMNFLFILFGILGAVMIYLVGFAFLQVGLLLFSLYWFFVRPFERRWFTGRLFKKRPDNNLELNWTFSVTGIETKSNLGESVFSWNAIAKIVVTPEGLMLYPTTEIFHWLPSSAFASLSDMEGVLAMADHNKVKRHKTA